MTLSKEVIWKRIAIARKTATVFPNRSQSAINTTQKIMKRIRQLADFPEIGEPLSSIISLEVPYRFLVCGNYTAFYKVEGDEVHIIRVLYGRRNFMQILFGRSYDE